MAGMVKQIKRDGKFRRMLAAWMGICVVFQTVFGSLGTISAYAEDTMHVTITVKESELLSAGKRAIRKMENFGIDYSPEIDDNLLPFATEDLKEEARNTITPFLMGTAIAKTYSSLGNKCTAIVAVSGEADNTASPSSVVDSVVFIGLNGNKNKNCEFTLEITDAENTVIRSMTVIGYAQSGTAASDSDMATDADMATGTDMATGADMAIDSDLTDGADAATDSDLTDGADVATGSNAATGSDLDGYGFVEVYRDELDENELTGLVKKKDAIASPGQVATPDETDGTDGPSMLVQAGGIGIAYAESGANAGGKVAQIQVFTTQDEVQSGAIGTIHIAADYSVIDDKLPDTAYFAVEFKVEDHKGRPYDGIIGPERDTSAVKVSELEGAANKEWKKVRELLAESDEELYSDAAGNDDWVRVTAETNSYFYSASARLAVFGITNGGTAITDMPVLFRFDNGTTPIGSTITATPHILNKQELKAGYESSKGPAHSGDGVLIESEPAMLKSTAQFWWQNINMTTNDGLGNMAAGTGVGNNDGIIKYQLSASKDYKSDIGLLFTTDYTVRGTITFNGFYLDVTGYGFEMHPVEPVSGDASKSKRELFLTKDGKDVVKAMGFVIAGANTDPGTIKPVYLNGDPSTNQVIGFEIERHAANGSLNGEAAEDMANIENDTLNIQLGIGKIIAGAKEIIKYTDGGTPSISSYVEFDAHSIMHEEDADNSGLELNDGITNHHSVKDASLKTTTGYSITKTAYKNAECTKPATGNDKIFEPGSPVYYKITAKNNGYQNEPFRVTDTLPDGLDASTVKTLRATVGKAALGEDDYTDEDVEYTEEAATAARNHAVKAWSGIVIPSGGQAEIVFEAKIKDKEILSKQKIDTTLLNHVDLFREAEPANRVAYDDVTVYANLNTLTDGQLNFEKTVASAAEDSVPAVGSKLTYTLAAGFTDGVENSHWITVKDTWPKEVSLDTIKNIPPQTIIKITGAKGNVLASYERTDGKSAEWSPNLSAREGITVSARVYLTKNAPSAALKLTGTVKTNGSITNKAQAEGGEGDGWTVTGEATTFAVGAAIEKKAYYISQSQAESEAGITDDNDDLHPVEQSVSFRAGDVVYYDMKLTNTGKDEFTAQVTDDITELFGGTAAKYAKATLNGQEGSVFMKLPGNDKWQRISTAAAAGKAIDKPVTLKAGEKAEFRIYVTVPEDANEKSPVNKVQAALTYDEKVYTVQASAGITINEDIQEASIEKEVYAVAGELETKNDRVYLKGARWNNPVLGTAAKGYTNEETLKVGKGDYVLYRIKINNEGDTPLKVYEIEDWLPAGMEFKRFYEFNPLGNKDNSKIPGVPDTDKGGDTLDLGPSGWARALSVGGANWLYYEDAEKSIWNDAAAMVNHGNDNKQIKDNIYRARLFNENINYAVGDTAKIPAGKSAVYGIIAQVVKDFDDETKLVNTAGVVVDKAALTDPASDHTVLEGSVGKRSYSDALHKIITDTATVITTKQYAPGIGKNLVQYAVQDAWHDYKTDGTNESFLPNYPMRWQVSLENGTNSYSTSGPIENYTVTDTLPAGLHYNAADTYPAGLGLKSDQGGNYMKNAAGKKIALPLPMTEVGADGLETVSWTVEKQKDGSYRITGSENNAVTTETDIDLSIPAKGAVTMIIGTVAGINGARYGTYVNQAKLIPDGYGFEEACAGDLVKDESGTAYAVRAEASVDIFFGDGRTEAWKEITGTFNGDTKTASGKDRSNNTVIADAGSRVTYALNVTNHVANGITNLVIVDRLPAVGDNGIVNNMPRNSDFTVRFTKEPDISVSIVKKDGKTSKLDSGSYSVTFADWNTAVGKGSALADIDWEPGGAKWSQSSEGANSLRLEITNEALENVNESDTIVVTYDAVLPEAEELNLTDELIAWNTFGYAYKARESRNQATITVEPPKVGVQIPTALLSVSKEVQSKLEEDKASDNRFIFTVEKAVKGGWEKASGLKYRVTSADGTAAGTKTVGEDGTFELSHRQTAEFTVLAGRGYRVKEVNAEGYYVTVTDFDGTVHDGAASGESILFNPENPPSASVDSTANGRHYYCTFVNARGSFFLPETGGMGTELFHRSGMALVALSLMLMAGCFVPELCGRRKKKLI